MTKKRKEDSDKKEKIKIAGHVPAGNKSYQLKNDGPTYIPMQSIIKSRIIKIQMSELTKERLIIAIRWLCMALFLYTAYAKIIDHDRFLKGLKRVHLIHGFAVLLSFAVPVVEIMVAVLLLIPKTSELGLKSFIAVMSSFTIYIICALIWEKKLPCNCGGAIEKLSWMQHIWFNLVFITIAIVALSLYKLIKPFKN